MVGMAPKDLETEVLRQAMLGQLPAPVLDARGDSPLTCMKNADTLDELLARLENIGGKSNVYVQREDGCISTLSVSLEGENRF